MSFDTAQVCLNGHVVTSTADNRPEGRVKFCVRCGAPTVTQCQKCGANIRGLDWEGVGSYKRPGYCHDCGNPYPWTSRSLTAASDLLDEDEKLRPEDRDALKAALPDLLTDTPRTAVSIVTTKRILGKVAKDTADGLKRALMDLAVETAKRALWPNP